MAQRVFSSSAYSSYKICIPNKKLRENDHKKKNLSIDLKNFEVLLQSKISN